MKTKQILLNAIVILAATSLVSAEPKPLLRGSQRFHQHTDPHLGPIPVTVPEATTRNPYHRFTIEDAHCLAESIESGEPSIACEDIRKSRQAAPAVQPPSARRTTPIRGGSERYHEDTDSNLHPIEPSGPSSGTPDVQRGRSRKTRIQGGSERFHEDIGIINSHPRTVQEAVCAQEALAGQAPSAACSAMLTAQTAAESRKKLARELDGVLQTAQGLALDPEASAYKKMGTFRALRVQALRLYNEMVQHITPPVEPAEYRAVVDSINQTISDAEQSIPD